MSLGPPNQNPGSAFGAGLLFPVSGGFAADSKRTLAICFLWHRSFPDRWFQAFFFPSLYLQVHSGLHSNQSHDPDAGGRRNGLRESRAKRELSWRTKKIPLVAEVQSPGEWLSGWQMYTQHKDKRKSLVKCPDPTQGHKKKVGKVSRSVCLLLAHNRATTERTSSLLVRLRTNTFEIPSQCLCTKTMFTGNL